MDTKFTSDLEKLEALLKDILATADRQAQHIADLEKRTEAAEALLEDVALVEKYEMFREKAKAEGVLLQEWILKTLHTACQSTVDLPIHPEIYRRLKVLAEGKGISMREFGEGDDISSVLDEALSNSRL